MKRRGFLGLIGAAIAAPFVPTCPAPMIEVTVFGDQRCFVPAYDEGPALPEGPRA